MLSFILSSLLASSPYPFEVKSGFVIEPTVGTLFQDKNHKSRITAGARLSYMIPDETDALISAELQLLTATSLGWPKDASGSSKLVTDTHYFFEASFVVAEIYNPMTFRLAGGGGVEKAGGDFSPDIYYRGGIGRYFASGFGVFVDAAGRFIFRSDKVAYPIEIGSSLQFIF